MKRQIVLVISLVCGVLAAVLTRVYVSAKESEIAAEKARLMKRYGTIDVLCFKKDTPGGTVINRGDLGVITVPALGMRGQALTEDDRAVVFGRRTVVAHKSGDVVFWADIEGGDPRIGSLSDRVKMRNRAVSINVNGAAGVSGMVRPNDHVDVIGTFNFPDDNGKFKKGDIVTCTILQNVLVLATGKETADSRVVSGFGTAAQAGYSTVTLEVTPREAEMLAFTEQMKGRLTLTLRNRKDTSTESELPNVDFEKIRSEIEELNKQRLKASGNLGVIH